MFEFNCWVKCFGKHCFNQLAFRFFSCYSYKSQEGFNLYFIYLGRFYLSHYRTGQPSCVCSMLRAVLSLPNSTQNMATSNALLPRGIWETLIVGSGCLSLVHPWALSVCGLFPQRELGHPQLT